MKVLLIGFGNNRPRPSFPRFLMKMNYMVAVGMLGCTSAINAGNPPLAVSFEELIKHPRRYVGKRVAVRAYLVTSCTHCRELWSTVQAARDSQRHDNPIQNWITFGDLVPGTAVRKELSERLKNQNYDGYVQITGRFQYRHMTPETLLTGFGWGQLNDKQITNITEVLAIGPPIPAGIK